MYSTDTSHITSCTLSAKSTAPKRVVVCLTTLNYLVTWIATAQHQSEKGHTQSHVRRHKSIRKYSFFPLFFFFSSGMLPNLIQHQCVLPAVSSQQQNTCFRNLFSLQCAGGVCVETEYISSFEWGNPLCTSDTVRHAVSKTGKYFCECHKISQTYTQGHTATEILCMYFWTDSYKRGEISANVDLMDGRYAFVPRSKCFFQKCITAINHTRLILEVILTFKTALSDASVEASQWGNKVLFGYSTVV